MNDADAVRFGVTSSTNDKRLTGEFNPTVVFRNDAGQDLHQGAFTGPVLTAESVEFTLVPDIES